MEEQRRQPQAPRGGGDGAVQGARPPAAKPLAELPSVYDPSKVEAKWYRFWEEGGFFRARPNPGRKPFTIVIPPPNVTGSLHMGHALDCAIQDILIRWHRMRGYEALWLPGSDHAGIATQHVVEKALAQEGTSREELGREEFIRRVWEWKARYGGIIINQLKRMGSSCDWDRLRFTMDEGCSRAVRQVFVGLYRRGLVYRDNYITNWCPHCRTALSDLEVEHRESAGKLYYLRYALEPEGGPVAGPGAAGSIVVATTRPETILGDTGVAVHPSDARYRALRGRTAILPLVGRRLPIVADDAVDPEFGTGAVKITPAHDPADFEVGRRHGLDMVVAIDAEGRMTEAAGPYAGLDRYQCREALLRDLERAGHLVRVEDHAHSLGHCYRCDTVVEPRLSRQWFVRMKPLAEPAIRAAQDGRVTFVPERFQRVFINWLENIRDWCISRQIWWGHRIPAWYCGTCGHTTVAEEDPSSCERCGSEGLEQDPDVLDTWFSSALWPFSTLGWPDRTPDLEYFFPTSVLVTGYDIIFFWVARMVFMSLEFMGQEPFRHVLIHGIVRDERGERMSKSRGTGIDPLEAVDRFGADALRFGLLVGLAPGNDMRFRWERLEGSRNFCNKLWNAGRFALS
ncbi:MAG: valine--tRNA ligase, partial [Acetobacteraceae bacterium]|nr:valine--tRNA ligase [Acetobacteraceae bacterium]